MIDYDFDLLGYRQYQQQMQRDAALYRLAREGQKAKSPLSVKALWSPKNGWRAFWRGLKAFKTFVLKALVPPSRVTSH